jgi:hypothetical protein
MANREISTIATLLLVTFCSACGGGVPASSACRNLVYKEDGLSRTEYLPCATEMMTALDEVAVHTKGAAAGDQQARSDGQNALARLGALMNAAGGRNLLERWRDARLTALNVDISNAVTHYNAFYMVRVLEEPSPYAAQSRKAADDEFRNATRSHSEARSSYRRIR